MLVGTFTIADHSLHLRGYDIANVLYLRGTCDSAKDRAFFDSGFDIDGEEFPARWPHEGIGLTVGPSTIKVEQMFDFDSLNVKYVNLINREVFALLGSLVRGMKLQCTPKNRQGFDGFGFDGGYSGTEVYEYAFPGGDAHLLQGEIIHLGYYGTIEGFEHLGEVQLTLDEDGRGTVETVTYMDKSSPLRLNLSWAKDSISSTEKVTLGAGEFYSISDIVKMNPGKSFDWLLSQDYKVVGPDDFVDMCKYIAQHKGIVSFDTETTGLNVNFRSNEGIGDTLVGMVFSVKEGESFYVPVRMNNMPNICSPEDLPYVMETYFKPLLERKKLVAHNASFDWKVMYQFGINCNIVADTLTAVRLTLRNDDANFPLGLKSLALRILGHDSLELDDFVEGSWDEDSSFADLDLESTRYYACADTDNTLRLWNWVERERLLDRYNAHKVFEIEVLFSRAIGYSEYYGMYADPSKVEALEKELEIEAANEFREMTEILGHEINVNSPKQLATAMYDELSIPSTKKTASGAPSTDKAVLNTLASQLNVDETPKYPFVHHLLKYRTASQLLKNFIGPFHKMSNEGFFHSSVNQFLETGRVSIKDPNYQSFNDAVKKYIEPRKGYYMFDCDFSSVEYRILVSIAGEKGLIEQFYDPDFDYHRRMASLLHGVPYEQVTSKIRSQSKGLNFGIPYGMSVKGLAGRMFGDEDPQGYQKAQVLYNKYFDVQPAVRAFFDREKEKATSEWYNETYFGRRRAYDRRKDKVDRIRRQAGNHPIQGTAADLYKLGIGRLFLELSRRDWLGKVLIDAFVHDEAVIECHTSISPNELLAVVREAMMVEIEGWCPLYIGAGFGMSWVDAKKTELPVQLQERIVKGEFFEWWSSDRDGSKLVDYEHEIIRDYMVTRVNEYLANSENWEKTISVVEGGFVSELVSGTEGVIRGKATSELEAYGRMFGVEELVEKAGIVDTVVTETKDVLEEARVTPDEVTFKEEDVVTLHKTRCATFGCSIDATNGTVYAMWLPDENPRASSWNNIILEAVSSHPGDKNLILVCGDELIPATKQVSYTMNTAVIKYRKFLSM